ncbi:MAG: DUF5060 domain-containing protein [Phycisphaerales bacterium]|nr:MAG: DUF5060 domain-containing protein [Phycisphaerales bacterium]
MKLRIALSFLVVVLTSAGLSCQVHPEQALTARPALGTLDVQYSQNTAAVPQYEIFEVTFTHDAGYADPFSDVTIDVVFTSASKRQVRVGGFHYGSSSKPTVEKTQVEGGRGPRQQVSYLFDRQDLWKARFAPSEPGRWTYDFVYKNAQGQEARGEGSFTCIKGRKPNPGFVRLHPTNRFRFVFDDGSPYFPIGLQDCWGDNSGTGSVLDQCAMEGPFRTDLREPPALPDGPLFVRGPAENPQNADVYLRYFSQCGFNLYRFSQQNCSYSLNDDLDHYLVQQGIMTDELLCCARKYNLSIFYGIFGFQKAFNDEPNEANMSKVKRFIKYSVDRWGAYVDFWEFLNEQHADIRWYEIAIDHLKSVDPYGHPVTTSWEKPEIDGIEINAPHWYQREDELSSDAITAALARNWKKHNKPVVVGEQGNRINRKNPPAPGVGGVWDERSALRMRIRNWTALFNEITFIFWNTSYARDGHNMNIWLGPKEREYVRAMQDFAYRLDKDVRMVSVDVSEPSKVRAYALASAERAGVYLHHFANHSEPVYGVRIGLDVPQTARGYWYCPETAAILETIELTEGTDTIDVPDFTVDIALLITPDGPPDIDADGIANHLDDDDDQDGVPDVEDAFPLDPEEWQDKDQDWIGDNLDADDDGDGAGDDHNANGIPDHQELDFDGDGVDRAKSIPWDAFPFDPKEWQDSDGDGTGDNTDTDDDNDGFSDAEEIRRGTDPKGTLSFPIGRL